MSDSSNHLRDTSFSGQDINNSIVNTGDYNSLILGNYESLDDALVEPGAVFDRVNLDHFSGRKWLLAQIDSFLQKRGFQNIKDVGSDYLKSMYFKKYPERRIKPWWRIVCCTIAGN